MTVGVSEHNCMHTHHIMSRLQIRYQWTETTDSSVKTLQTRPSVRIAEVVISDGQVSMYQIEPRYCK